jgi:protein-L-isoaspartate(D-aspartate) O-methyltransferase
VTVVSVADDPADRRRRARMVRDHLAGIDDPRVLAAMAAVPRHAFVPEDARALAYDDGARPIGNGQTISQPRVVALMLAALALRPGMRVLDVGAGSGYAAALLAQLVAPGSVLALERQGDLVARTRPVLQALAPQVDLRHADGLAVEEGPFDAIHIGCACTEPPRALIAHLAPGGRLIAPVGPHDGVQRLLLVDATGERWLEDVLFVPALPGTVGG